MHYSSNQTLARPSIQACGNINPAKRFPPSPYLTALHITLILLLQGCEKPPIVETSDDNNRAVQLDSSHEKMKQILAEVANNALQTNEYFQTRTLTDSLAELSRTTDPLTLMRVHFEIADDLRRLGKIHDSVGHLESGLAIIADANIQMSASQSEYLMFQAGVTYLRLGETENCVNCRSGDSCILPISAAGQHADDTGSRRAIEYFQKVLVMNPNHLSARWLLNIASMTLGDYPSGVEEKFRIPEERFSDQTAFPRFKDVATASGIQSFNCGGGVVSEDLDNDGDFDLLTSTWDPSGAMHLFENDGTGKFTDVSEQAGLGGITGGINMIQADYDNDGDIDIFVVRGAWLARNGQYPNSLLQNDGTGNFSDVSLKVGIGPPFFPSSSAAWLDFDNDGDVDLFVANEQAPCQLFRNDRGDGFKDIARDVGVTNDRYTKGVTCGDINGDGLMDIYLSNLDGANRLYVNDGKNRFTDQAAALGVERPSVSFPTWFWDVNNDGHLDLFVASYVVDVASVAAEYAGLTQEDEGDRLYLGKAGGGFSEASGDFGLNGVSQPMGSNFGDLDNDGYLDFSLGTGYPQFEGLMPNLMFRNVSGTHFEPVTYSGGFAHLQKGHGTTFCDFDHDGDQDVFIQTGGAYPGDAFGDLLFENPGFSNNWVRVKAIGTDSNRSSIGARIRVDIQIDQQMRSIYRWVNSGGSFGANSLQQHFGIGSAELIQRIEVYWPATGTTRSLLNAKINSLVEMHEQDGPY